MDENWLTPEMYKGRCELGCCIFQKVLVTRILIRILVMTRILMMRKICPLLLDFAPSRFARAEYGTGAPFLEVTIDRTIASVCCCMWWRNQGILWEVA